MDVFLREINYQIFKRYVYYCLPKSKIKNNQFGTILIHNQLYCQIFFTNQFVIELSIEKNNKPFYYLHFEFIDFSNAIQLFHDFMEYLIPHDPIKVLICCSSALTSSYLVEELKKYIQKNHENINITASSFHHIYEKSKDNDLILLAPQVGYLAKKYACSFNIQVIPTNIYATYNYSKIVEMIKNAIKR